MGYRQQLLVIAKVDGKYRTLALLHHQWMYGRTSLRQALNTINILKAPRTVLIIRRELFKASKVRPAFRDIDLVELKFDADQISATVRLFPFIATILIIGSSLHDEGHYSRNVTPQILNTEYYGLQNDDSIIIFDIADLERPRYAFVWLGLWVSRAEYEGKLPKMTVLDAKGYIASYYNAAEVPQYDVAWLLKEFEGVVVIRAAALNEQWTTTKFKDGTTSTMSTTAHMEVNMARVSVKSENMSEIVNVALPGGLDRVVEGCRGRSAA